MKTHPIRRRFRWRKIFFKQMLKTEIFYIFFYVSNWSIMNLTDAWSIWTKFIWNIFLSLKMSCRASLVYRPPQMQMSILKTFRPNKGICGAYIHRMDTNAVLRRMYYINIVHVYVCTYSNKIRAFINYIHIHTYESSNLMQGYSWANN